MDDQRLSADLRRRIDVLLEQLAAWDANPVVGRRDVDEIGSVDVQIDTGRLSVGAQRGGAALVGDHRSFVALRIAEEELRQVGLADARLRDRVGLLHVSSDTHGPEPTTGHPHFPGGSGASLGARAGG